MCVCVCGDPHDRPDQGFHGDKWVSWGDADLLEVSHRAFLIPLQEPLLAFDCTHTHTQTCVHTQKDTHMDAQHGLAAWEESWHCWCSLGKNVIKIFLDKVWHTAGISKRIFPPAQAWSSVDIHNNEITTSLTQQEQNWQPILCISPIIATGSNSNSPVCTTPQ